MAKKKYRVFQIIAKDIYANTEEEALNKVKFAQSKVISKKLKVMSVTIEK